MRTLLLILGLSSGCFHSFQSVKVSAERIEPGGKGLFVVRPSSMDQNCEVGIRTPGDPTIDCNSEYLVGCDGAAPDNQQFCSLMREKGPARDSIYPAGKR